MEETQITAPQNPSRIAQKRPLLLQKKQEITTKTLPSFQKYALKYVRKVTITKHNSPKAFNLRFKLLDYVSFQSGPREDKLQQNQAFKFLKHHKNSIQHCLGFKNTLLLAKVLPQLSDYRFEYPRCESDKNYKIMGFSRALKRACFDLDHGFYFSNVESIAPVLDRNCHRIRRALMGMRSMKELCLKFSEESSCCLFPFLQLFGSCPGFLSRLQLFSIQITPCNPIMIEESDLNHDINVKAALKYVTHLSMLDAILLEKFVFSEKLMENLRSLGVFLEGMDDCEGTIRKLASLKVLFPGLKALEIDFISDSEVMEQVFIESFSLPRDIENVILKLNSFLWKDLSLKKDCFERFPYFQKFNNEWAGLDKLQSLELVIYNRYPEKIDAELTLKLAKGVLSQTKNLKRLLYQNGYGPSIEESWRNKRLPMDLGGLWRSLKNSKKTLVQLEIQIKDINFFTNKEMEEDGLLSGFERLKRVEILGQTYGAYNFGDFLERIAKNSRGIISVNVRNLCVCQIDFFNMGLNVPKNLEVQLTFDLSEMSSTSWIERFCEFLQKVKVEGVLKLRVSKAAIWKIRDVERIQGAVMKNPVFEEFIMEKDREMKYCVIKRGELVAGVDKRIIDNGWISFN